jgi:phage shock protein PspC (stress-responsive transcriptional regulator)
MTQIEKLEKLQALKVAGTIDDSEFIKMKAEILERYKDGEAPDTNTSEQSRIPTDPRYRSIYCSSDEKKVLGLCGGLAHKTGLPVAAVRFITFICLFFVIGWVYFVGIFLPKLPTKNVPRLK